MDLSKNLLLFIHFLIFFFPFKNFNNTKKTFKNNNNNNNYINQLLRLTLLKHTHTHLKIIIIKGNTNLPPQGISTSITPQMEALMATVKEKELSAIVTKTSTPEVAGILDPFHSYVNAA